MNNLCVQVFDDMNNSKITFWRAVRDCVLMRWIVKCWRVVRYYALVRWIILKLDVDWTILEFKVPMNCKRLYVNEMNNSRVAHWHDE
jgi:hypothetical protein